MSDIPRFACFSDGMREGYNESWVRSSDYDALCARANENELCAAAVVEIRRLCKEIMGGNLSFVDDDFARCLLTLRAERDALAAESSAFGGAIIAHNIECQRACGEGDQEAVACGYRPYFEASGRRCSTCPTQYMIDAVPARIEREKGK